MVNFGLLSLDLLSPRTIFIKFSKLPYSTNLLYIFDKNDTDGTDGMISIRLVTEETKPPAFLLLSTALLNS